MYFSFTFPYLYLNVILKDKHEIRKEKENIFFKFKLKTFDITMSTYII